MLSEGSSQRFNEGSSNNTNYGMWCYDYSGTGSERINNDYLELLQGFPSTGDSVPKPIPANKFCGVYDGRVQTFPGITSTYWKKIDKGIMEVISPLSVQ